VGAGLPMAQDMVLALQIRVGLGRRPYRFGHRTPALYSRN
jgi:hypothetical protein